MSKYLKVLNQANNLLTKQGFIFLPLKFYFPYDKKTLPTTQSPGQEHDRVSRPGPGPQLPLLLFLPKAGHNHCPCGLEAHLGARAELGESSTAPDVSLESSGGDPRVQATQRMISRVLPFQVGTLHRSLLTPWRGAQPDEAGCHKARVPCAVREAVPRGMKETESKHRNLQSSLTWL